MSEPLSCWPASMSVRLPFYLFLIFIYSAVLGLRCGMWDLVPPSEIEPRPPVLGGQSLSHWTTREVLCFCCC